MDFSCRTHRKNPEGPDFFLSPFCSPAEMCAWIGVLSNVWTRTTFGLNAARAWKSASNAPHCDGSPIRFQIVFQGIDSAGRARRLTLCAVK
jgi:hypothetical protein